MHTCDRCMGDGTGTRTNGAWATVQGSAWLRIGEDHSLHVGGVLGVEDAHMHPGLSNPWN